jgi:class 3 adenylate cyclase
MYLLTHFLTRYAVPAGSRTLRRGETSRQRVWSRPAASRTLDAYCGEDRERGRLCQRSLGSDPVAPLPRGTVALLFTDIEGSTRLLERLGDSYGAVLQRHRDVLAAAFAVHGGVVVETEGDAMFVAFDKATAAVAAAIDGQRAILAESWPPSGQVRVRMGMHCGEVELVGGGYVGLSVHVAARVSSAAHGGQIIITEVTARLAGDPSTLDLGRHRLKDVGEFRLLQLRAPDLEE